MTTDDFLKSQYEGEINRRDQLSGSLSIPLAVLTVLAGALLGMGQSLRVPFSHLEGFILVAVLAGGAGATAVVYYLFRFQLGHEYSYVATAQQIDDYRQNLETYYRGRGQTLAGVEAEVLSYIRSEMIGSAHDNALRNDRKSGYLNKAYVALAICASLTFLAAIPYTVAKVLAEEQPFAVRATLEVG